MGNGLVAMIAAILGRFHAKGKLLQAESEKKVKQIIKEPESGYSFGERERKVLMKWTQLSVESRVIWPLLLQAEVP